MQLRFIKITKKLVNKLVEHNSSSSNTLSYLRAMGTDDTQPHNAYIHTSQYGYITNTQYLTFRKVYTKLCLCFLCIHATAGSAHVMP